MICRIGLKFEWFFNMQTIAAIILTSLVAATAGIIFSIGRRHVFYKAWARLLGELFIPFVLLLTYGFGSLLLLLDVARDRWTFTNAHFTNLDLLFSFITILIAIVAYIGAFKFTFIGMKFKLVNSRILSKYTEKGVKWWLIVFLLVDIGVRLYRIKNGLYFNWMVPIALKEYGIEKNIFYFMQITWAPLLGVLLYWQSTKNKFWFWVLAVFCLAVFLEGDRSTLVVLASGIFLAHLSLKKDDISFLKVLKRTICITLAFILLFQLIISIRVDFRRDLKCLIDDPSALPGKILTEYLPNAMSLDRITGTDDKVIQSRQGFAHRLKSWPAYLASIHAKLNNGYSHLPVWQFFRSLALPIPSILYPGEKPVIESGEESASHFNFGGIRYSSIGFDPACTIFADIYAYFNIFGVIFLSVFIGFSNAAIAKFLIHSWGKIGSLVFIGLIGTLQVTYNSFANALVNIRSQILMIIIIIFFIGWARTFANTKLSMILRRRI